MLLIIACPFVLLASVVTVLELLLIITVALLSGAVFSSRIVMVRSFSIGWAQALLTSSINMMSWTILFMCGEDRLRIALVKVVFV